MALPLIAAGIAARAVAKKLATRAAGGIMGAGAKSVNPVYKNTGTVKVNSNPNKTPAKSMKPNPTEKAIRESEQNDALRKMYYNLPKNEMTKDVLKINSNPMRGR
jgi:hypothetical protein